MIKYFLMVLVVGPLAVIYTKLCGIHGSWDDVDDGTFYALWSIWWVWICWNVTHL